MIRAHTHEDGDELEYLTVTCEDCGAELYDSRDDSPMDTDSYHEIAARTHAQQHARETDHEHTDFHVDAHVERALSVDTFEIEIGVGGGDSE